MAFSYEYTNLTLFLFHLITSMMGISVNLIYLWVTTIKEDRRKHTDITLITACLAKVFTGGIIIIRSMIIKISADVEVPHLIYNILEWGEFCFDCIFIWSILILSTFRYILLKNLDNLYDHGARRKQSKKCLLAAIATVFLATFVFAVIVECHSNTQMAVAAQMFDVIIKKIPLCTTLFLQTASMVHIFSFLLKSNRVKPITHRRHNSANDLHSRTLLKQALYSQFFQIIFYLLPSLILFVLEFLLTNCEAVSEVIYDTYIMGKILLVIFSPLTAGLLLQPRRDFLLASLGIVNCSNRNPVQQHPPHTTERNMETAIQGISNTVILIVNQKMSQKCVDSYDEKIDNVKELQNKTLDDLKTQRYSLDFSDNDFQEKVFTTGILFENSYQTELHCPHKDFDASLSARNCPPRRFSLKHKKSVDLSLLSFNSEMSVFHSHADVSSCCNVVEIGTETKVYRHRSASRTCKENSTNASTSSHVMSLLSTASYAEVLSFC